MRLKGRHRHFLGKKIDLLAIFSSFQFITSNTIYTSKEEAKRRREEEREERFRALVEENDFAMVSERARILFFFSLSLLHHAVFCDSDFF